MSIKEDGFFVSKGGRILISIILLIVGIFIFLRPDFTDTVLATILSVVLLINGLILIMRGFISGSDGKNKTYFIIGGVVLLVFSFVFFINNELVGRLLSKLIGATIIIIGITLTYIAIKYFKLKFKYWFLFLIGGVISLFVGLFLVVNSSFLTTAFNYILGLYLIFSGIYGIASTFRTDNKVQ